jgi:hypothetical protein
MRVPDERVEVYEHDSIFHYQAREVGVKNQNANPTLCGLPVLDMRKAAWFDVGDKRGKVHFARGCEECRERLVF